MNHSDQEPTTRKQQRAWALVLGLEVLALALAIAILALGDPTFGAVAMVLSGAAVWRSWHLSGRGRALPERWVRVVRDLPLLVGALVLFVALFIKAIASFDAGRVSRGWFQVVGLIFCAVAISWAARRIFASGSRPDSSGPG